ncbi:hypothetical protein [Micromonospora marina]|uniref:hypothetical protein n=1 Tax=Micromonospora marina TaxID=307120 RepID=UPI003D736DF5
MPAPPRPIVVAGPPATAVNRPPTTSWHPGVTSTAVATPPARPRYDPAVGVRRLGDRPGAPVCGQSTGAAPRPARALGATAAAVPAGGPGLAEVGAAAGLSARRGASAPQPTDRSTRATPATSR